MPTIDYKLTYVPTQYGFIQLLATQTHRPLRPTVSTPVAGIPYTYTEQKVILPRKKKKKKKGELGRRGNWADSGDQVQRKCTRQVPDRHSEHKSLLTHDQPSNSLIPLFSHVFSSTRHIYLSLFPHLISTQSIPY